MEDGLSDDGAGNDFLQGWWIWGKTGEVLLWIAGILTFITGYQYLKKPALCKTEAGQKKQLPSQLRQRKKSFCAKS